MSIPLQITLAYGVTVWSEEGMTVCLTREGYTLYFCLSSGLNSGITECVGVIRMGLEDFSVPFFRLRCLLFNSTFPVENLVPVIYRTDSK